MRHWAGGGLAAVAMLGGSPVGAAGLEIRDAVVRVVVLPEARADVVVEVIKTNPKLPLRVSRDADGRMLVDGGPRDGWLGGLFGRRAASCDFSGAHPSVTVWGIGQVAYDEMPQIIVRTPLEAQVTTSGATIGSVGRADRLDLTIAGCDDWTLANVRGRLRILDAGSGHIRAGTAGELDVNIAGSGAIGAHAVADGLRARIEGSGTVDVEAASGPVEIDIAGHGDVRIGGGHATRMSVNIIGSGDVTYRGVADSLRAAVAGSGDIAVAKVTGPVSKSIAGSGNIDVGR